MTDEIRFQTGFRGAPTGEPGLVMHLDGTVWLVAPDGSETQLSPGASAPSIVQFVAQAQSIYDTLDLLLTIPNDPVSQAYGEIKMPFTSSPALYAASDNVATFSRFTVERVDTRHDSYIIEAQMIVTNADQSEHAVLNGTATAGNGVELDTATINSSDLSPTIIGDDLSWDGSNVVSAAGGTYSVQMIYSSIWD